MILDRQNIGQTVGDYFRLPCVQALEAKGVAVEADGVRLLKKRPR